MAALSDTDRAEVWAEYMREVSKDAETLGLSKADLRAALNATDDWIDANVTSFNSALPQPARSVLTTSQKARLMTYVIHRRFIAGA